MKDKLTFRETISVASLLFGLFFGAGNLIFPVHMGQLAGGQVWPAIIGFIITGVTIPILGVAALGVSRKKNLVEMSESVGKKYSIFFTCATYLTIGPFFAIPRCCTTPYTIGIVPLMNESRLTLAIFSFVFFAVVLFFSLRPNGILTWIGKILNPIFLGLLAVLVLVALFRPEVAVETLPVDPAYAANPLFKGFIEGYGTMDGIASLAFGVIVITTIQGLGVDKPQSICNNTIKSGIYAGLLMAVIYGAITVMGAQSLGYAQLSENGGIALADISNHYFGKAGTLILALTICFACLKTAIGLVTSCAEIFTEMFPRTPGYKFWAVVFTGFSFCVSNVGLTAIITYAVPVLMFLYPLCITIIFLSLFGRLFGNSKIVYQMVTGFTLAAAFVDFLKALPEGLKATLHLDGFVAAVYEVLPFAKLGLGWVVPALVGLAIGLVIKSVSPKGKLV